MAQHDDFAKREIGGRRFCRQRRELLDVDLIGHIYGNNTIGVYVQSPAENCVKTIVLDVDCRDSTLSRVEAGITDLASLAEFNFNYMRETQARLQAHNLPSLIESSDGNGGYHLWVFVAGITPAEAINSCEWMAQVQSGTRPRHVECFPSGAVATDENPGQVIRLPGRHPNPENSHYSTFFVNGTSVSVQDMLPHLQAIQPATRDQWPQEALEFAASHRSSAGFNIQGYPTHSSRVPPIEVLSEALTRIGSDHYDRERGDWLNVGMALYSCSRSASSAETLCQMWRTWSLQAPARWNEVDAARDWNSFANYSRLDWRYLLRIAIADGYQPPAEWLPDAPDQPAGNLAAARLILSPEPTGTSDIAEARSAVQAARQAKRNTPGVWFDSSGTGSGKSSADLQMAASGGKCLVVVPNHQQANELAREMVQRWDGNGQGIVVFPKRTYESSGTAGHQNCWNPLAQTAERSGLRVDAAVCSSCHWKSECRQSGYLGQLKRAKRSSPSAPLVIMTQSRAQLMGLPGICREYNRDYVALHEQLIDFLRPIYTLTPETLNAAASQLRILEGARLFQDGIGFITRPVVSPSFRSAVCEARISREQQLPERHRRELNNLRSLLENVQRIIQQLQAALDGGTVGLISLYPSAIARESWMLHRLVGHPRNNSASGTGDGFQDISALLEVLRLASDISKTELATSIYLDRFRPNNAVLRIVNNTPLPSNVPVWLCDATTQIADIQRIIPACTDQTPAIQPRMLHRIQQVPHLDITKKQTWGPASTIARAITMIQDHIQNKNRIFLFGFQDHVEHLQPLLSPKFVGSSYFYGPLARGSNEIYRNHDLILILGTPRAGGPESVVNRLLQLNENEALQCPGEWYRELIQYELPDGGVVPAELPTYRHQNWREAYNAIIREEIYQVIGRARLTLADGCDVIVFTPHELGLPILNLSAFALSPSEKAVFDACKDFSGQFTRGQVEAVVEFRRRAVQSALTKLVRLGDLQKIGRGRATRYAQIGECVDE